MRYGLKGLLSVCAVGGALLAATGVAKAGYVVFNGGDPGDGVPSGADGLDFSGNFPLALHLAYDASSPAPIVGSAHFENAYPTNHPADFSPPSGWVAPAGTSATGPNVYFNGAVTYNFGSSPLDDGVETVMNTVWAGTLNVNVSVGADGSGARLITNHLYPMQIIGLADHDPGASTRIVGLDIENINQGEYDFNAPQGYNGSPQEGAAIVQDFVAGDTTGDGAMTFRIYQPDGLPAGNNAGWMSAVTFEDLTAVPEPGSLMLAGGIAAGAFLRRRRR